MSSLANYIDLSNPQSVNYFTRLLGDRDKQTGVYDHLKTKDELLDKLHCAQVEMVFKASTRQPSVLCIHDIDIGTPQTVTRATLNLLVQTNKLDPQTPVHLRALHGVLFLFVLKHELKETKIKTSDTHLAFNLQTKEPWMVRLGAFTPVNEVWGQVRFNAKVSTLEKTLKIPYLKTFSIACEQELDSYDVPW